MITPPAFTYGSVCSGIEAASVAWHPLGWRAAFLSEIEEFPRAVLQHHYPDIPLHGDFTTIKAGRYAAIDLLVGGTPCQSFSVAGLRGGLGDGRGNLALEYLRLAQRLRPRWLLWENVPGVFSSLSHAAPDPCPPPDPMDMGRDGQEVETTDEYDSEELHAFQCFMAGVSDLGYGLAYRVLDAQYFGLAQRRERVFVVGYLGDWRRAASVLFEPASLSGHPAPRRGAREDVAGTFTARTRSGGANPGWGTDEAAALTTNVRMDLETETFIAHTLRAEGFDASEDGTGRGTPLVPATAFSVKDSAPGSSGDLAPALRSMSHAASHANGGGQVGVLLPSAVRRLTPRECARLQGFPDDYLDITFRGKPASDGAKYRALGNSMAVPVMAWIGRRIAAEHARIGTNT